MSKPQWPARGLFPVVDFRELEDEAVELCKSGLGMGGGVHKKRDHDQGIVDESLRPDLIEIIVVVLVGP